MEVKSLRLRDRIHVATQQLAEQLASCGENSFGQTLLKTVGQQLWVATEREYPLGEVATLVAELFLQARLVFNGADPRLRAAVRERNILPDESTMLGMLLRLALSSSTGTRGHGESWLAGLAKLDSLVPPRPQTPAPTPAADHPYHFDAWLAGTQKKRRATFGVYYTPDVLARYVVRQVDQCLRQSFDVKNGLADTIRWRDIDARFGRPERTAARLSDFPFVRILDPALGSGIFLIAAIDHVQETMQRTWIDEGLNPDQALDAWNEYVSQSLLPRLFGVELLLPTAAVAWLRLAEKLCQTGYRWDEPSRLNVFVGDTLIGPRSSFLCPTKSTAPWNPSLPEDISCSCSWDAPITVVLGNPPFSALSTSRHRWMDELLRAEQLAGHCVGSYYQVDGQPLGEKKLWLHDDYVQFLRFAQWQIQQAGCGVVGLVTSHGYLENLTFRGMRQSLLRSFSHIDVLDLHGNRKKLETPPASQCDENVFEIEQGIAVGVFARPLQLLETQVRHGEIWGSREQKLDRLRPAVAHLTTTPVTPCTPHYFFVPTRAAAEPAAEYKAGYSLTEVMPVYSSAAVTARDALVVGLSRDELLDRFQQFTDPQLADSIIRQRFLSSTRSRRYPTGDTRSWRLPEARASARAAGELAHLVRQVQYRPFDRRPVLWADWLIDWPRANVMRHLLDGDNLALVSRRQMPSQQPCNFFFVTDTIVIDGLLRSDNRGNESFFPLYLQPPSGAASALVSRQANLAHAFVAHCLRQWPLEWLTSGSGDLDKSLGPADVLAMCYAQFYSSVYRERYANELHLDFPRLFVPRDRQLFGSLCRLGRRLIDVHRMKCADAGEQPGQVDEWREVVEVGKGIVRGSVGEGQAANSNSLAHSSGDAVVQNARLQPCDSSSLTVTVAGKYPMYSNGTVHLSEQCRIDGVPEEVWHHRIGSHQVCRKWLRDRRGRMLAAADLSHYCEILTAIARSLELMREIDVAIDLAGGWPTAFVGKKCGTD